MASRRWQKMVSALAFGAGVLISASGASARGVVVDDGLIPNLILGNAQALSCDATGCSGSLPFKVLIGTQKVDTFFAYGNGIVSLGQVLPEEAFASEHFDLDNNSISVAEYFAQASFPVFAPKFFADNQVRPGGSSLEVTTDVVRNFAAGNIDFCGQGGGGFTVCPDGYIPFETVATQQHITQFIALNGLNKFVGDYYIFTGPGIVAFRAPKDGLVTVELFQPFAEFGFDSGYYTGAFNNITENDDGNATRFDYVYRLELAAVPEPASWAMMISGFGLLGATARRRFANMTHA